MTLEAMMTLGLLKQCEAARGPNPKAFKIALSR